MPHINRKLPSNAIGNFRVSCRAEISDTQGMNKSAVDGLVARNIQGVMDERGLKAEGLAEKAGLNRTAIYDILSGKSASPRLQTLEKIASAAGVDLYRLTVGPLVAPVSATERKIVDQIVRLDPDKRQRLEDFLTGLSDG